MTHHQKVDLTDFAPVGAPGPLPDNLRGLAAESLEDMSWSEGTPEFQGFGFWPMVEVSPVYNSNKQMLGDWDLDSIIVDVEAKEVIGTRLLVDRPDPQPDRMSKIDFWRLFTLYEKAYYEGLRKQLDEMSSVDLANSLPHQMLRVVFRAFDMLPEFIEIDHPETVQGLTVLQQFGMLTEARLAAVLAKQPPPPVA